METVKIYSRSAYGIQRTYVHPDSAAAGAAIVKLTRRSTLDLSDIRALQELGLTFQGVADPKSFVPSIS